MKNILLIIIAALLIPAAVFADKKTTASGGRLATDRPSAAGSNPASASAGKAAEKCVIPKLEHEEKLPSGETVTVKDPIPENLSDKCYCKAVRKKYINYKTANPTFDIRILLLITDRAFKCFVNVPPEYQPRILTEEERIRFVKDDYKVDLKEALAVSPFSKYPPYMP